MAEQKHILIVCGEASGDLAAANLAQKISEINPKIKISAVGGSLLRAAGARIIYDIKGLAVIGLFDALKKLPKFLALRKFILQKIKEERPDIIILVDFSGFNLRLAKAINPSALLRINGEPSRTINPSALLRINGEPSRTINKTIPIIYYVSPQVWASRPGRVKTIKNYINKMLVLFKFEEEFYKRYGINADFVGHPLLDIVRPQMAKEELQNTLKFSESKKTIALLPGSRKMEIKNILPVMLRSAALINKEMASQFIIAKSAYVEWGIYNRIIHSVNTDNLSLKIIEAKTYDSLNIADFALVASGTATLETAIMQIPFCVIYKTSLLNYLFYLPQVKVPYVGMVNIVAGKKIVPEFIQFQATPKEISKEALRILKLPSEIERIKDELSTVKSLLGEKGASYRAAKIIVDFLDKH